MRVLVIVSVLLPVLIQPVVMLSVGTLTLLANVTPSAEDDLLTVNILNVVAPVIEEFAPPRNCTVPDDAV